MYTVYGIRNCDTVKKALIWLDSNKVDYVFHDYKTKGITSGKLTEWVAQKGWEPLVNTKGMTWRQLDESTRKSVTDSASAIRLMESKTSVIKRPLVERDGRIMALGFNEKEFQTLLDS